jgi:hypothetical protein
MEQGFHGVLLIGLQAIDDSRLHSNRRAGRAKSDMRSMSESHALACASNVVNRRVFASTRNEGLISTRWSADVVEGAAGGSQGGAAPRPIAPHRK